MCDDSCILVYAQLKASSPRHLQCAIELGSEKVPPRGLLSQLPIGEHGSMLHKGAFIPALQLTNNQPTQKGGVGWWAGDSQGEVPQGEETKERAKTLNHSELM